MKRKILIALFVLVLLPLLPTLKSNAIKKSASSRLSNDRPGKPVPPPDHPGTINGAQQPERIPDRAAYSILFRVLCDGGILQQL